MINVLLLNASYEPLAVISQRRAISLILKGRVEAVCEEVIRLHSRSTALDIPTIIRLRRYVNVPRRGIRWGFSLKEYSV